MNAFSKPFLPLCWPFVVGGILFVAFGVMVLVGIGLSAVSSSLTSPLYLPHLPTRFFGNRPLGTHCG